MPTGITRNRDQLRKRVNRFFEPTAPGRADVFETLRGLRSHGRVLVFGGAIRDLALHGASEFPADIDVVLEGADVESMSAHFDLLGATRNRFGGFRFATKRWKYDVWRLEDTWALREGHVKGVTADALLGTTFFDWDAIAYDFTSKQLLAPADYFEKLDAGLLGINLPANPNPAGNARRALRIYSAGTAGLGSDLVQFVAETTRPWWENGMGSDSEHAFPGLASFVRDLHRTEGRALQRQTQQFSLA